MIKTVILVAVRLKSNRLNKKALIDLGNKPLLIQLSDRVKKSKLATDLVLCTSTSHEDDQIEKLANENKIKIFRGSENDVMSRFIKVGKELGAKNIVRVTGDNPLTDPEVIDYLINIHNKNKNEYTYCDNIPIGTRSEIIDTNMLSKCYELIQDRNSSEYMTWMLNRPDYFKTEIIKHPNNKISRPELSFTIDYPEDHLCVNEIYKHFQSNLPSLEKIIEWVDLNPNLIHRLKIKENKKKPEDANWKFKKDL
ncbi:MAG: 3-deoxy-manno-octulosonate cytidylyltransferase [Alphaproteobacteria bacterium MarineAlpha5_Bin9]|nr:MAG: 3-deoxy-manno-octulosonate cytidylyltransferase [Alphaproteobacteria bacterium MarineAlpha5_Bin9]|tara:strand:- start:9406 stop:10161 length:756 start_codon:yes stop_codon:yes gene_type:complete